MTTKAKVNRRPPRPVVRPVASTKVVLAKLPAWMVAMAKAVGDSREPRENVAEVFERLAGDALASEYAPAVAATKASAKRGM